MRTEAEKLFSVLFVGHLYPQHLESVILDQPFPPVQTQRFGEALMLALIEGFGKSVQGLSVASLLDFPKCKLLIAPKARWYFKESSLMTMLPFINLMGLKHLTRFVATFLFTLKWALQNRSSKRVIIMHGVQSCKIWGVLCACAFLPALTFSFLTDDLGLPMRWEGRFSRMIRRIDVALMKQGLQRVSGILTMTQQLADRLAPGRPSLIIHAIHNSYNSFTALPKRRKQDRTLTVGYFGGLYESYGVDLLLDIWELDNRHNQHLVIAGVGDLEARVKMVAARDIRVKYLGFLPPEELSGIYQDVDVLVNPRLTSSPIAALAFPSKLVEYLSTGKPVITTDLPVFDENFRRHLLIAKSDTPESLFHCIEEITLWSDEQYESWRIKSLDFLQNELSPLAQGQKIRYFVDLLHGKRKYAQ